MKAATLIPLEEYLATTYHPDCDYVDGQLVERNVGEHDHSDLQTELAVYFRQRRKPWKVHAVVEQRVQERIDDYLKFGVRYVWLINPPNRRAWIYTAEGSREVKDGVLRTENPALVIPLAEVFAGLED